MQRILYIDCIFLENLVMDLFLVALTARTLKNPATFFRMLGGSLLGAGGYCLVLCLAGIPYTVKVLFGMIPMAMGMVRLGCGTKGIRELLVGVGWLFTYSFLLGGFILFLIKRSSPPGRWEIRLLAVLFAGGLGFGVCMRAIRVYRKHVQSHFCTVEFEGDESGIRVYGLIDTGNGLVEPVSGKRAAILEERVWNKMKGAQRPEKYKIIPYHSIGKENGILEGYEIDRIRIRHGMGERELAHMPVAVSKGKLTAGGGYQMILPPEWLEGCIHRKEE